MFTRNGTAGNPNDHQLVKSVHLSTHESDGSEVTTAPLNSMF
jgi:3-phytase